MATTVKKRALLLVMCLAVLLSMFSAAGISARATDEPAASEIVAEPSEPAAPAADETPEEPVEPSISEAPAEAESSQQEAPAEMPTSPAEPEVTGGTVEAPAVVGEAKTYPDTLLSGKYYLTTDSYDSRAMMKLPAVITIDTEKKTFYTQDTREGENLAAKGSGTYTFDPATGVYTVTYTADTTALKTTTFTHSAAGITFTTPMAYGGAKMNTVDNDGNFLPYTAKFDPSTRVYSDTLTSGKYALTEDSYDAKAIMKMPAIITIDTDKKTFYTQDARKDKNLAAKGSGTYTFDPATGVYTVTYTADTRASTTTFTHSDAGITFTSPMAFGNAVMNTVDENEKFLPYTAKPYTEPETPPQEPDKLKEGTYTGQQSKEAMSGVGIEYDIRATLAGGKYSYDVHVKLSNGEYDADDSTKTGTYTVKDNQIIFDGGNLTSGEITGDGKLKVYGKLSDFAFASDYAELTWASAGQPADPSEKPEKPETPTVYPLTEGASADYDLGSDAGHTIVCQGPAEKFTELRVDGVVLDPKNYTLASGSTKVTISGAYLSKLSAGIHRIVLVYADGESTQAALRVAAKPGTYSDDLKTGKYELKLEDFDAHAGVHRHPCIITIDAAGKTFIIHDTNDAETNKGSGSIRFDDATGEYTMTYTAGGPETQDDPTTNFVFRNDSLVFTSPLKLGRSMMNIRDDSGAFLSYTAKRVTDTDPTPPQADPLKAGRYALTEESYDPSAFMKMPAIITIDTDKKTFSIADDRESTRGTMKGSGTYAYNAVTGVYTMTYTGGVAEARIGATATFTYANDAITFTSPMLFGNAMMNIVDEEGNFIPYTAKLLTSDTPAEPTAPEYVILDGANGTVAQGASADYQLRCSGPLDQFVALYMDGTLVDEANYQKSAGSTVITLSGSYLKTLSAGQHTIKLVYTDGEVETKLTVRAVSGRPTSQTTRTTRTATGAKTGDQSNLALWIVLMAASLLVLAGLVRMRKRGAGAK